MNPVKTAPLLFFSVAVGLSSFQAAAASPCPPLPCVSLPAGLERQSCLDKMPVKALGLLISINEKSTLYRNPTPGQTYVVGIYQDRVVIRTTSIKLKDQPEVTVEQYTEFTNATICGSTDNRIGLDLLGKRVNLYGQGSGTIQDPYRYYLISESNSQLGSLTVLR